MKIWTLRKLILAAVVFGMCISHEAIAQTQSEMNLKAGQDYIKCANELNAVWRKVLTKYADNKSFKAKLRKSESAWINYRDKYLESIWPTEDTNIYGDAFPMSRSGELCGLTLERTKYLKAAVLAHLNVTKAVSTNDVAKCESALTKKYRSGLKATKPDEPLFAKKFQQAQEAWTAFRDADADAWQELDASAKDPAARRNSRILELDKARITELDQWVHGIPEGCIGVGTRVTY